MRTNDGRWLFQHKYKRIRETPRRKLVALEPPRRILIDLAEVTAIEMLDCVRARIDDHKSRGTDVPHVTRIAEKMLLEVLTQRVNA